MSKTNESTSHSAEMVGLVDCNNFFVSCERLFRPDLATRPVLVLSSNDGCVISRSAEVKKLGIPMGIPYFEVRDVIREHGITIFSSNFALYRDISARVMDAVGSVVTDVEAYSIDEAFFTVQQAHAAHVAQHIRARVQQWVGVPVSVGCADSKTLAKLAGDRAKRRDDGVYVFGERDREDIRATTVGEVWGVGPSTRAALVRDGMQTVGDVLGRRAADLRALLGVNGERLFFELSGVPASVHHEGRQTSIMSTRSFGKRVTTFSDLLSAVSYHLSRIAEKLRVAECGASGVQVYVRYTDTYGGTRSLSIPVPFETPLSDTMRMAHHVTSALRAHYDHRASYTKAGVTVYGMVPRGGRTDSLFGTPEVQEQSVLMSTVDRLNRRHGTDTVRIGTLQKERIWDARRVHISQSYTTSWTSLPMAHMTNKEGTPKQGA